MTKLVTIPTTIDPDAAALLAEIGQEAELELMLEHARATIPHLGSLHISLHDFPETGSLDLLIEAHRAPYPGPSDRASMGFSRWMVETFPPDVLRNFGLITIEDAE